MNLHEYQARGILARYSIPLPPGEVATSPEEAEAIAQRLGGPVVVKAQVLVGGRGKAGGITLATSPAAAREASQRILGMAISGIPVKKVLVAEAQDIAQELYLGIVIDRAGRGIVAMASAEGGVEIEETAKRAPEKIARVAVDPFWGLMDYRARELALGIGLTPELLRDFVAIAHGLYRAFVENDASLAEINPLAITRQSQLVALDAKIVLDDSALFRHKELAALREVAENERSEEEARAQGFSYVKLEGDIGCLVNGAGLAMATMDAIQMYGGLPANFLDIGGGATAERVAAAFQLLLARSKAKVILVNIFGGITRCDEVARGIVAALQRLDHWPPIVARVVGTNEEEGRHILAEANLMVATTMEEAAQRAVEVGRAAAGGGP